MADVLHMVKPDGKFLREFADEVEGFVAAGRNVRATLTICMVDDDLIARVHTQERLSSTLGMLVLAGKIVYEDYNQSYIMEDSTDG